MTYFASSQVILLSLVFLFSHCAAYSINEVEALISFKRAIIEDPLLVLSNWNHVEWNPCNWSGVSCSIFSGHIIKLNISGASLKGFIAPQIYHLSTLQELILHGNSLMGTIPKEIGMLKNLKVLDLGSNRLTGKIPPEIGNLTSIENINLQSNELNGKLPHELGNLIYLEELRLGRNKFVGAIPASNSSGIPSNTHALYASNGSRMGICGSSSRLKVVDLSYNYFVGNIPKCLKHLSRSSFQGNCLQDDKDRKQRPAAQCGAALPAKARQEVNTKRRPVENGSKPAWLLALEIVMGIMVTLLVGIILLGTVQKLKRKTSIIIPWKKSSSTKDYMTIYLDSGALNDVMRYSREELEVACEDFSNIIGSNRASSIYKGTIKGGPEIAVVSLCSNDEPWTGYLELCFLNKVADLARLNHENTVKLLGYCRESNPVTRMLVFEYASNGTLYDHLHFYEEGCQFSWTRRMKIIIGIARGLKYLHTELDPAFTVSELSSSSVYLTEDFSPKLVDFGSTINEGVVCSSPKNLEGSCLDIQGNIYAFGILILEIVSGRPPYCKDKGCLVDWAKEYLAVADVTTSNLVDPELKHFRHEDLKVICEVVNLCIHPSSSSRKSMQDLCSILESGIDISVSAEIEASLAWAELAISP